LDRLVTALSTPGVLFVYPENESSSLPGGETPGEGPTTSEGQQPDIHPGMDSYPEFSIPPASGIPGTGTGIDGQAGRQMAGEVQKKVDRPVEKEDLVRAGLIILRKLNTEEISYLYRVGRQDSCTREELIRSREILLNKLSEDDIRTLRTIGAKYGKPLRILDPNVKLK
jgi:hypothetical protein